MEHHKVIMDILPINKDSLHLGPVSSDSKEVILQIHSHIVGIMEELHRRIADILHQLLHLTIRKDLEVLQLLDSIHTLLLEITRQGLLLQEAHLAHIPFLLEILTQEIHLPIQIAVIQPPLVATILHPPNLGLLLDIPLNLFHLYLKTRMFHQNHQMCLQEGLDRLRLTRMLLPRIKRGERLQLDHRIICLQASLHLLSSKGWHHNILVFLALLLHSKGAHLRLEVL